MTEVTFITGNQSKADYLAKHLGHPVRHQKVELDEIQSLDLRTVVEHKVRQAYKILQTPVLVDDVALEFTALGKLPGTFIRFYIDTVPLETICRTLDGLDRTATARAVLGYYDGNEITYFEGSLGGRIAEHPTGEGGFGWDKIFIPDGYEVTRAELSEADDRATYLKIKPLAALKAFLQQI